MELLCCWLGYTWEKRRERGLMWGQSLPITRRGHPECRVSVKNLNVSKNNVRGMFTKRS